MKFAEAVRRLDARAVVARYFELHAQRTGGSSALARMAVPDGMKDASGKAWPSTGTARGDEYEMVLGAMRGVEPLAVDCLRIFAFASRGLAPDPKRASALMAIAVKSDDVAREMGLGVRRVKQLVNAAYSRVEQNLADMALRS